MKAAKPGRWKHLTQKYEVLVGEDPFEAEVNTTPPKEFDIMEGLEKGEPQIIPEKE